MDSFLPCRFGCAAPPMQANPLPPSTLISEARHVHLPVEVVETDIDIDRYRVATQNKGKIQTASSLQQGGSGA
eukprot:1148773-Pelagomonas_calceolata.AAC.5